MFDDDGKDSSDESIGAGFFTLNELGWILFSKQEIDLNRFFLRKCLQESDSLADSIQDIWEENREHFAGSIQDKLRGRPGSVLWLPRPRQSSGEESLPGSRLRCGGVHNAWP